MENSTAGLIRLPSAVATHIRNASHHAGSLLHEAFSVWPKTWDEKSMTDTRLLVSVVDDDESVRESLPDLLNELGFAARTFCSAEEFLESPSFLQTRCLLLDIAMPGMGGPELQLELKRRGIHIPIVFITARRDEAVWKRLLEQGAVECLLKPFSDTALLDALHAALRVN
jgi:FixJ family two-component response regulator